MPRCSLSLVFAAGLFACAPSAPPESTETTVDAPAAGDAESNKAASPAPHETAPPSESDPPTSKLDEGTSSEQDWLKVGEVTDGATLTSAEVVAGPASGATLILAFDGKGPPPATRARVENPKLVVVVIEGVRGTKANLPLVTGEGFRVIGQPRKIERGTIQSIGRGFYGDDSGIRIDVELSAPSTIELVQGTAARSVELRVTPAS